MITITTSPEIIKTYHRLVVGLDGMMRVSNGTRSWPASALAMALMSRPTHRIVGNREGEQHV